MIVMPKRDNTIYQEIEAFEDYELTQCIAYEMAIRNDKIKEAIEKCVVMEPNDEFGSYLENLLIRKGEENKNRHYIELLAEEGFDYLELIQYICLDEKDYISSELGSYKLEDILNNDELNSVCTIERLCWNSIKYTNVENDIIETNEEFLKKYLTSLDWAWLEPSEQIIKCALARKQQIKITSKLKRPTLKPYGIKSLSININPSLPKDEFITYITKIKDDYDNSNSILQSPLELLGEQSDASNKKISKKKLVDKFFVYDYLKARLEKIEELNKETQKAFNEEVEKVKSSPYLDGTDKITQINMLKKDLRENVINTSITDIFEEEELTSSIPKGTAKRYYYEMKPYIEDGKYKELITGIRT